MPVTNGVISFSLYLHTVTFYAGNEQCDFIQSVNIHTVTFYASN